MYTLMARTHQADFKELAVTKANGVVTPRRQCLDQKAALEHTTQTTADYKLAYVFCACVRGISLTVYISSYQ